MEYAPQQPIPGLEEYEVQPVLPFDSREVNVLDELDALHETINEFELSGRDIESWVHELYEEIEKQAITEGLIST